MADFLDFWRFVRNAPRGASGVFLISNVMLVQYFSKTGHGKTGDCAGGGLLVCQDGLVRL